MCYTSSNEKNEKKEKVILRKGRFSVFLCGGSCYEKISIYETK